MSIDKTRRVPTELGLGETIQSRLADILCANSTYKEICDGLQAIYTEFKFLPPQEVMRTREKVFIDLIGLAKNLQKPEITDAVKMIFDLVGTLDIFRAKKLMKEWNRNAPAMEVCVHATRYACPSRPKPKSRPSFLRVAAKDGFIL